jgi:cystathionine beta-lyase
VPRPNVLGCRAALAAYRDCEDWLEQLLRHLAANRDRLFDTVSATLPGIRATRSEATYLAWLDCRNAGIVGNPQTFFLEQAGVALNDGADFGLGGEGFVRLNFACPSWRLSEGLERMRKALEAR